MAETLHINVVTPRGPVTSQDTDAITAPGDLGEFEVLPGHVPFLTGLHPGVLVLGENRSRSIYAVSRGFLRVDRSGQVEVLVEQAVEGTKVNVEAAEKLRAETEAELDKWKDKPQDGDWRNVKDRYDWAKAQLEAHSRAS